MRGAPVTGPHFAFEQVAGDKQVLATMAMCLRVPHAELSAPSRQRSLANIVALTKTV